MVRAARSSGAAIAAFLLVTQAPFSAAEHYLVRNVNVVAMTNEGVIADQDVLIESTRIQRIAPAGEIPEPESAVVVDGRNRYLMPGIAEMHAHVPGPDRRQYAKDVLLLYAAYGVTTIRGMLGHPWHLELREQLERGEVLGPRLYTAGPSLNGNSVPDVATARRMVREQHAAGYDFLKLHPGLTRPTFDAIADTANDLGMTFEGHVSAAVGLQHSLDAGQRAIDHLDGYVEALAEDDCARSRETGFFGIGLTPCIDQRRIHDIVQRTRRAGAFVVPTQVLIEQWALPPPAEELLARSAVRYLPPGVVDRWLESRERFTVAAGVSAQDAERYIELRRELIRELDAAGVGVVLGSDAPQVFNVPGDSALEELQLYVAAGLTPYRALLSATSRPADFFGAGDRFGRVVEGYDADLLLLAANPLEDVRALRQLEGVWLRGRWLSRAEIDSRLEALAERQQRAADQGAATAR